MGAALAAIPYRREARLDTARKLRVSMTDAERKLWCELRQRQMSGLKFRRQHRIGKYIADFVCLETRVIIEVDGGQHTAERDALRTQELEALGFRVIRFWNNDVLTQIESVKEAIWNELFPPSQPSPTKWGKE